MRTVSGKYLRCVGPWGGGGLKFTMIAKKIELFTLLSSRNCRGRKYYLLCQLSRQIQLSFTRADCLSNGQIRCSTVPFAVNISFFTCMLACTNTDTARKTAADDWDYIPSYKWPLYLSHTTYTQELDKWYFYFPSQLSQHLFSPIYKVDTK